VAAIVAGIVAAGAAAGVAVGVAPIVAGVPAFVRVGPTGASVLPGSLPGINPVKSYGLGPGTFEYGFGEPAAFAAAVFAAQSLSPIGSPKSEIGTQSSL
jgi:hypothetical protein